MSKKEIPIFNADDQRRDYLASRGYRFSHVGNGGHHWWVNKDIEAFFEGQNVALPPNLASASTIEQKPGAVVLTTPGCNRFTWERIVKQINWAEDEKSRLQGRSQQSSAMHALKQEIRENIRSMTEDRRALCLQRRALCQAFKKGGVRAAVQYLGEIAPQLNQTQTRIGLAEQAVAVLRQRTGNTRAMQAAC